ncbi:hypothetical protein F4804DRAFT_333180 [Jackrogersella minutella]|nr:hypothetical protein F4804DRAFT_333180 [Jackrogersella minutella]
MANLFSAGPALPLNNPQSHNRSSSAPQTPLTPYQPHSPMEQPKTYSRMFDKVIDARRQTRSKDYDFYTDEDVKNYSPRGWPSIAATQMYFPNFNSQRVFGSSTQQVLTSYQQKLHCIEDELDDMNFRDNEHEDKPLTSLPFDPKQFIARCTQGIGHLPTEPPRSGTGELDNLTKKDNLIISQGILLREYLTLLGMHFENGKFPRVSRAAHEAHFDTARYVEGLNNQALAYMRYIDDFVCTGPDYVFQRFESLLYTRPRFMKFLGRICCLFCRGTLSSSDTNDSRVVYSLRPFELFFKVLIVLGNLSLLIIPVSLLYLKTDWTRGGYLTIVAVSSSLFAIVMAIFESRTAHLLVGLAAFYAVLVTFLSNLPNCAAA